MSTPSAVRRTSLLHQVAQIRLVPLKSSRRCRGTCTRKLRVLTDPQVQQETAGRLEQVSRTWRPTYCLKNFSIYEMSPAGDCTASQRGTGNCRLLISSGSAVNKCNFCCPIDHSRKGMHTCFLIQVVLVEITCASIRHFQYICAVESAIRIHAAD